MSGIELRTFREGDERAINEAFNSVFRQRRSLEEWGWKFPPWPRPRTIILAFADGELIAHNAGVPARIQLNGAVVGALQCVDTFSLAGRRRRREWRSLWQEVMNAFADEFGGGDVELLYGFPGPRACAQAVNRCGYNTIQPQRVTALERIGGVPDAGERYRLAARRRLYRAEPARDWEPRLDDLWRAVAHRYPVAVVRDAEQALYRLSGRPGVRYHRFLIFPKLGRQPVAFVAFRTGDGICRWVDLLWHVDHPGALELITHLSHSLAANEQGRELMWLDLDHAARLRLEQLGYRSAPDPSGVKVVYRALSDRTASALRRSGGLYLTMADADLV